MRSLLALLLLEGAALAGTVTVQAPSDVIPAEDAARLQADGARWPFDVVVRTIDAPPHRGQPGELIILFDAKTRKVDVGFGSALRVRPSAKRTIQHAGDDRFRTGLYALGVESICDRLTEAGNDLDKRDGKRVDDPSVEAHRRLHGIKAPDPEQGSGWPLAAGALVVGIGGAVVAARRRDQ